MSTSVGSTTNANKSDPIQADQPNVTLALLADELTQSKLTASLVLFVLTMLCGYLPVRTILNQRYVQLAIFAGGGVLMATAFCHIIPEAHDNFRPSLRQAEARSNASNATQADPNEPEPELANIPYVELTICFGFFFIYLTEQLTGRLINTRTHKHPCDSGVSGAPDGLAPPSQLNSSTSLSTVGAENVLIGHRPSSSSEAAHTELYKFIRGFLIVSAFIVHSIFDGVAIGSQESVSQVWTVFFAISCHKLIIAAVVGFEVFSATLESHLWTLIHLAIFSIMSPLGIILIVIAQNTLNIAANDPVMVLLQSFAAGTLLYIVFIEILQPKGNQASEKNKLAKSVSLVGGFLLMAVVLTFTDAD